MSTSQLRSCVVLTMNDCDFVPQVYGPYNLGEAQRVMWKLAEKHEADGYTRDHQDGTQVNMFAGDEWLKVAVQPFENTADLPIEPVAESSVERELRRDLEGQVRQCEALRACLSNLVRQVERDGLNIHHGVKVAPAKELLQGAAPVRQSVNVQMLEALRGIINSSSQEGCTDDLAVVTAETIEAGAAAVSAAEAQLKENDEAIEPEDQAEAEAAKSVYAQLKAAGVPLDNHESDLYAKVTPESQAILDAYSHRPNVTVFRSNVDNCLWYDIPFAFLPWWEKRASR